MFKLLGIGIGASLIAIVASKAMLDGKEAKDARNAPQQVAVARTGTPQSNQPQSNQPQAVSLAADSRGHFITDVKINGKFVQGLVDTGATSVAIPAEVARSIGLKMSPTGRRAQISTANGVTSAEVVRLEEVRISTIVVRDVEAVIVEKGLPITLIGMSFIRRLSSEMRGNTLVLRQ